MQNQSNFIYGFETDIPTPSFGLDVIGTINNQFSDGENYGSGTNIGRFQLVLHVIPSHFNTYDYRGVLPAFIVFFSRL